MKNETRKQSVQHLVPATDEVIAVLDNMKARFPELDTDRFLIELWFH